MRRDLFCCGSLGARRGGPMAVRTLASDRGENRPRQACAASQVGFASRHAQSGYRSRTGGPPDPQASPVLALHPIQKGVGRAKFANSASVPHRRALIYFGRSTLPHRPILAIFPPFRKLRRRKFGWRQIIAGKEWGTLLAERRGRGRGCRSRRRTPSYQAVRSLRPRDRL